MQGITQADIEAYCPQLVAGDALADAINALLQGHRLELFHNEGGHLVYRATSASNAQKCAVPGHTDLAPQPHTGCPGLDPRMCALYVHQILYKPVLRPVAPGGAGGAALD